MASEHDNLIRKYEDYKERLANYQKELYLYESKISEYGENISSQLSALRSLGVDLSCLDDIVRENGELDLTDKDTVRRFIEVLHVMYKSKIDEGMNLLNGGD